MSIVWKVFVVYLKRTARNYVLLPLLLLTPLIQFAMMRTMFTEMAKKIGEGVFGQYTELIVMGSTHQASMIPVAAASTMVYFLLIAGVVSVAMSVQDRQAHTLMRTYSTPASRFQLLAGNFTGQLALALFLAVGFIVTTHLGFGLDWGPSWSNIAVLTLVVTLVTTAYVFALSTMFKNVKVAIGVTTALGFIMTFMSDGLTLGGQFDAISKYTINKWAYDAFALLMQGGTLRQISEHLWILGTLALVLVGLGCILSGRERNYE